MNRIPVVNEDQRASYGAPTTDVGAGQAKAPDCGACQGDGSMCATECKLAAESPPGPRARRAPAKKKPTAKKAKAKK